MRGGVADQHDHAQVPPAVDGGPAGQVDRGVQPSVDRLGVIAATARGDVGQVLLEGADVGGEVPGTGDVVVAAVAEGDEAEAGGGAAGQLLDAAGDGGDGGLDLIDLIAHAAGGVEQEDEVEADGTGVILEGGQGDGLRGLVGSEGGGNLLGAAADEGTELRGLGRASGGGEEEDAAVADGAGVEDGAGTVEELDAGAGDGVLAGVEDAHEEAALDGDGQDGRPLVVLEVVQIFGEAGVVVDLARGQRRLIDGGRRIAHLQRRPAGGSGCGEVGRRRRGCPGL